MTVRNPQQAADAVDSWVRKEFGIRLTDYGDIGHDEEEGLCFTPDSELDLDDFAEIINTFEDYEAEKSSGRVVVHKTDEISGVSYKHKVGVTFRRNKVPLGGVDDPIQDDGPIDEATEETIQLLSKYYSTQNSI
ncbi:hypothetical protein [Halorussus lipolyticus]|uniref:hypothetical protein n=1 Tax=Halorussus lipolyticus TaxID=3034024 RepID=UPI0023E86E93|nr:hypothetical protein [Halorussus sp. DT80]